MTKSAAGDQVGCLASLFAPRVRPLPPTHSRSQDAVSACGNGLTRTPSTPQPPPRTVPTRPTSSASRSGRIRAGLTLGSLPQEVMRMGVRAARREV